MEAIELLSKIDGIGIDLAGRAAASMRPAPEAGTADHYRWLVDAVRAANEIKSRNDG